MSDSNNGEADVAPFGGALSYAEAGVNGSGHLDCRAAGLAVTLGEVAVAAGEHAALHEDGTEEADSL